MFPNYELINETNIPEKPINPAIYNGDLSMVDEFVKRYTNNNVDYIVMTYISEINLDDRRILANVLFEKWRNGMLPKYLDTIIDDIPQEQFYEESKIKWLTGKWSIKNIQDENSFLDLVENLNSSKYEFMNTYFKCISDNKPYILESSILSFLNKAKYRNYKGSSYKYKKKLELYRGKKLDSTLTAIDDAFDYNIDNTELRLLNILINIQDSNRK